MSSEANNQIITPFQIFSLLLGVMLGFGALTISRFATMKTGRDGWISVLLAGLIIIINSFVMIKLSNRFPGKTITQYSQDIIGKIIGKAIGLIFVLSAISLSGLTLSMAAYVIKSWILTFTPTYVIGAILLIICTYACSKNLKVIGRINLLLFFSHIVFFFLFLPPVTQTGNFSNILPIANSGWGKILAGIPFVIFCFAGYELIPIFYAFSVNKKKSAKAVISSVVMIVLIYTFAVATQIIVFPLDYLKMLWVPSVNFIAVIYMPFIERLDLIFISSWIFVFFKVASTYYYAATIEIQQIMSADNRKIICYCISPFIFLISFLITGIEQINMISYWITSLTILVSLIIPIILLILSILLKKGVKQ